MTKWISLEMKRIMAMTGCSASEAEQAEDIMRHDIFHSTLDWQSRTLLDRAAKIAIAIVRHEPLPARTIKQMESGTFR